MDYINLDMMFDGNHYLLVKKNSNEIFNSDKKQEIYKSNDGVVIAKEIKPVKKDAKVYKLYEVHDDDTLQKLTKRFFQEFPTTRKYYTESQLINEIIDTNGLKKSTGSLSGTNFLTIPAYLSVGEEEDYPDYEEHFVTVHEQNYYQIVLNEGYTNDSDEIQRLADEMRKLNGSDKPIVFSTIKIPCVKKYRVEHPSIKR